MTLFSGQLVTFGKFFPLLQLYWNYCREREHRVSPTEFLILTMAVYENLKEEWIKCK